MPSRRRLIAASVSAGFAAAVGWPGNRARAQRAKSMRMIVGFPPGGSIDYVARLIAEQMKSDASIIVDNRPGAGGRIALQALKGAAADGSVLLLTPGDQLTLFPHIYRNLGYVPSRDFTPVTTVCRTGYLITAGPMLPPETKTLADFLAWCRANPKQASYGTAGAGTRPHFLGVLLARAAGVELTHVPYKGGAEVVPEVLAGRLPIMISTPSVALPQIRAGGLRALATTAPRRGPALPDVPTVKEAGFAALEAAEWFGVLVPAGTPAEIVNSLNAALQQSLKTDKVIAGMEKMSLEVAATSPAELASMITSDTERWAQVVKASGFEPLD
jgi:tripartite-type tricarboxylate transporter receptor subunit TctC